MLAAYFDESHQSAETVPVSATSALVATGLQWRRFSQAWRSLLESEEYNVQDRKGRRVFHTSEFESPEGRRGTVYENWSPEKRNTFHRALLDVIASNNIVCCATSVITAEYLEVTEKLASVTTKKHGEVTAPRSKLFGNAFAFCAYMTLRLAIREALDYYRSNVELACYFEAGGRYQTTIDIAYKIVLEDPAKAREIRLFSAPVFAPKDFALALQAADKIAYEAGKEASHTHSPNIPDKYAVVVDGQRRWKERYALTYLKQREAIYRFEHWPKEIIEEFFVWGESKSNTQTDPGTS